MINRSLFSVRMVLSVVAGVTTSVMLISFMRNYILATVLGSLVAIAISGLRQPKECAWLGLACGSLAGFYLGARNYLAVDDLRIAEDMSALASSLVGWLALTGLLSAFYGFLTGKFFVLYKKSQGPFF